MLEKPLCQRTLIGFFNHFSQAYLCGVASFCVLGNHYHLVVKFDKYRKLSKDELIERASILYTNSEKWLKKWNVEDWAHFNERIFDLSEFMRNVQAAFARWYNRTHERRGRLWADRFKSVYLGDLRAVLDCMLYVELNAVRAGLVKRPEKWKGSSLYLRECDQDDWLIGLKEVLGEDGDIMTEYRNRLYYRGNIPTKEGQASIPDEIIEDEEKRGFKVRGMYRKQLRYFVDGVILGSAGLIRQQIVQMCDAGQYRRRKNPIEQLDGIHLTLREQRSHAVCF